MLTQTKTAVQSYIVGLLIEMIIVAVLNSAALLLLGVKYAILLGLLGALLNTADRRWHHRFIAAGNYRYDN